MELFPYTNLHEMNLDWIINKIRELVEEWNKEKADLTELKEYILDYFKNLDLQEEVNKKIDEMVEDGTFDEIILNINGYIGTVLSVVDGKLTNTTLEGNKKYILMEDCELDHTVKLVGNNIVIDFNNHNITSSIDTPMFQSQLNDRNEYGLFINGRFTKPGGNQFIFDLPNVYKYEFFNCRFTVTGIPSPDSTLKGAIKIYKNGDVAETGYVNKIENCHFTNALIHIDTASDGYVTGNIIWNYLLEYAVIIKGAQHVFNDNQIVGIVYVHDTLLMRITNNYFDGNVGDVIKVVYGLLMENVTDSLVCNNTFTYCENALKLLECDACIVSNNNFWDNNKLGTGIAEVLVESTVQFKTNTVAGNTFNYWAKRQQTNNFVPIKETTDYCFTIFDNNIIANNSAYKDSEISEYSTNKLLFHAITKKFNYPLIGKVDLSFNAATVVSANVSTKFKVNQVILTPKYSEDLYNKSLTCSFTIEDDRTVKIFGQTPQPETGNCEINYVIF